jgi:NTE family protein
MQGDVPLGIAKVDCLLIMIVLAPKNPVFLSIKMASNVTSPLLSRSPRTGLVLVGGGARGAYQAGVLKGLGDILGKKYGSRPFLDIITGVSAGGINAAYIASRADRMLEALDGLYALWKNIHVEQVMKTGALSLASMGSKWVRDLTLGGLMPASFTHSNHLLDTAPLRDFLSKNIDFPGLAENIRRGTLHGFAVSATNYNTGTAVTFFDGHEQIKTWTRSARLGRRSNIHLEHVVASASIPFLFRPVPVEGAYYGDGGIRMSTPLSPAIHLGSDRVLAISIRHPRSDESTVRLNLAQEQQQEISVADIAGVMLNAAFLDGLDGDAERMERINETIQLIDEKRRAEHPYFLRTIPLQVIRPSMDLGLLAVDQFKRFPLALRYVLKGIGASDERGSDFMSYLAFDPAYTAPLLELGRSDALALKDEIEAFFLE